MKYLMTIAVTILLLMLVRVASANPTEINDKFMLSNSFDKHAITVVDAYTDWCGACQAFHPTFVKVSNELGDKVFFAQINIDHNVSFRLTFNVEFIPTILVFKNGHFVKRIDERGYQEFKKAVQDVIDGRK